jgi:hypothetical protein
MTLKSTNKPTQRGRATGAHLKPGPTLLRAKASGSRAGFGSKYEELDPVAAGRQIFRYRSHFARVAFSLLRAARSTASAAAEERGGSFA